MKKFLLFILFVLIITSCSKSPTNPISQRSEYKLLTDDYILSLSWSDNRKQDYFYTNWMNTFTNQTIIPAGVTTKTRTTDSKATYLEDSTVLGNFIYATNIEWKGTNWIGALYEDPRRSGQDSRWMIFHVDLEGNFMLASAFGTGAVNNAPTEDDWKGIFNQWGSYATGILNLN